MAKLGVYFGLCPLIDHRSLLGVAETEESGVVVVTLGKNIAIKYKLSDQKQINSWRTKEKFSTPIIYDKATEKYVAGFNHSYLRMWSGDEESIDKLKKYKFKKQLYTIFVCDEKLFILFGNGAVAPLNEALETRQDYEPDDVIDTETENIGAVLYTVLNDEIFVGLLINGGNGQYLLWTKFDGALKRSKYAKISLNRPGEMTLTGYLLHSAQNTANFLSLWSDGRVFCCPLQDPSQDSSDLGELYAVIEAINCKEFVSMVSLDENYIAIYGADCNEEGALLVIYNVQFKVVQSKQLFKLFTREAKLWRFNTNLFLTVGRNLAVVPFHLDTEQLAALVGSHKITEDCDPDISIVNKVQLVSWNGKGERDNCENKLIEGVAPRITDFSRQGLPESLIADHVLPELIEKNDIKTALKCIKEFSDIPERLLAKLLRWFINFKIDENLSEKNNLPQELIGKTDLIDSVLIKSFSDVLFLAPLRTELSLDDVLILLKYFCFLLSPEGHPLVGLDHTQTEAKLIEWSCVLIDSSYQKLTLSKDEKIHKVVSEFNDLIRDELKVVDELWELAPLLDEIVQRKSIYKSGYSLNQPYSIEEIVL